MDTLKLGRGVKLFFEGDPSKDIFFLTSGTLLVMKGAVQICELTTPAMIGELGCILNAPRSTTVFAKTPAELTVKDGKEMLSRLKLESGDGIKILEGMAKRFDLTRTFVIEYQHKIINECMKILAVLIAEKQVEEKDLKPSVVKKLRSDAEIILARGIHREDPAEDLKSLKTDADKYRVKKRFDAVLAGQFRSFTPLDLEPFNLPSLKAYLNFKTATEDIARKIVVLTRYLADFQTLDIPAMDTQIIQIEKNLPFGARARLLREIVASGRNAANPEDVKRAAEFEAAIDSFTADPGHASRSLLPVAKCFDADPSYVRSLQAILKDSPAK